MTIKKPMKVMLSSAKTASATSEDVPEMPAAGGATIADRFKLDAPAEAPKKSGGGVGAMIALVAALAGLAAIGILTFVIYQHWEFLKGA